MRRSILAFVLTLALAGALVPPSAFAGTTGTISGRVNDSGTHAPLAGVKVIATSPSGTYETVSDARGFYSLTGIVPDTYTLSANRAGYDGVSVTGLTVFADEVVSENPALSRALKLLANVKSHSRGGAFQPNQTTTTYSVDAQQINDLQGNVLNNNGRNLLKQLPGVTLTQGGPNLENTPIIRGGRANAVSFEFEGIPVQDARTNSATFMLTLPGFAVSEMQSSPGVGDASSFSGGTGTVNELTRRGTYPSFADLSVGAGGGMYNHALAFDFGTATRDGRWSEYFAFTGVNAAPVYGSNAYTSTELGVDADISTQWSRQVVNNLLYHWGPNKKYTLQLLTNTLSNDNIYAYGNTQGYCFESCDQYTLGAIGYYTGLAPSQLSPIIGLYPGQTSLDQNLGTTPPVAISTNSHQLKLEFDDAISASTYLQLRAFRTDSLETINQASTYQPSGAVYLQSGGPTSGLSADLTKQLNEHNMLKLGGYLDYASPIEDAQSYNGAYVSLLGMNSGNAMLYDFVPPSDPNCPIGAGNCGYLYQYFPGTAQLQIPPLTTQTYISTHQYSYYLTDRYSPNDKINADIGFRVDRRHYEYPAPGVDPATCTTMYAPASWTLPASGMVVPGQQCPTATFGLDRGETDPSFFEPRLGLAYKIDSNDAARVSFGRSVSFPQINAIDNNNINQNYGQQFAKVPAFWNAGGLCLVAPGSAACGLPAGTDLTPIAASGAVPGLPLGLCGIPGYNVPCTNYAEQLRWTMAQGFSAIPIQPLHTATYSNYDFALQHQIVTGLLQGVGMSLDVWGRRGWDLTTTTQLPLVGTNGQIVHDANGNVLYQPAAMHDNAIELANGEELRITRIVPNGLSAQLGLTWQHVMTNVPPTGDPGFFGVFLPSESAAYGGTTPPASLDLGLLYPISYSPRFATSLDLSYKTRNGWRLATQIYGTSGYPLGAGNYTALTLNGTSTLVPNTNYSAVAAGSSSNNTSNYIDPLNPGTVVNPVISATRGTPEGQLAGEVFSHPDVRMNATLEKDLSNKITLGLTVNNIFNESYVVPQLNNQYQPVANGVAGPLSGADPNAGIVGPGHFTYLPQFGGNQPYVSIPYGIGRTYYVYFTVKNL